MPKRKCSSTDEVFAKNLLNCRKRCDLTQQQVADLLNINRTTYTKYETGVSEPSFEILRQLAILYDVEITKLFDENYINKNVITGHLLSKEEHELLLTYRLLFPEEQNQIFNLTKKLHKSH